MSESDKSGKQELTAKRAAVEIVGSALSRKIDEVEALKARIAELEAISKALIKTLQVSLPIVSAPLRETFEIAIAKAKDKLLKP